VTLGARHRQELRFLNASMANSLERKLLAARVRTKRKQGSNSLSWADLELGLASNLVHQILQFKLLQPLGCEEAKRIFWNL
jgi:hypothetical protein